jgi:hypothetical protein
MALDTLSPILQLTLMATGNDTDTWGGIINNNFILKVENAIAGKTSLTVTGGTTALTTAQRMNGVIDIRGTLTSNVLITDAFGFPMRWVVYNGCTLGGFTVSMSASYDATPGTPAVISTGLHLVYGDGQRAVFVL